MAEWQSGYAAACKAVDLGSIPGSASNFKVVDFINLASIDIRFSRRLLVRGKAEPRRFRHSKASGSNAVRGPAGDDLSIYNNKLGAPGRRQYGVATLDKGTTLACALRLATNALGGG